MNRTLLKIKRPFVRVSRLWNSCGFGIQSPFAFDLLTQVIRQSTPYYKYKELIEEEKRIGPLKGRDWSNEPLGQKQLLFRLVNYCQPHTILDVGLSAASSLYLRAAKVGADYWAASDLSELFLENNVVIDFLYLHDYHRPDFVREVFDICATRTSERSLFVVEGIGYSKEMRECWKYFLQDKRVGITFDLYDVGLLFFDTSKTKQHYIAYY